MTWEADGIVGVIFVAPQSKQEDANVYWEMLFPGVLPNSVQRNGPNLQSIATGQIEQKLYAISVQVGRIDFSVSAVRAGPPPKDGTIPRIVDLAGQTIEIGQFMKRVASNVAAIRLAIVPELSRTVSAGEEFAAMRQELRALPLPAEGSDLTFSLNVRMTSGPIVLNRLLNWTAGHIGYLETPIVPGVPMPATPLLLSPFIGLKIDVNTIPEQALDGLDVGDVIDRICAEAVTLAAEGLPRLMG
jgi:hypothetical protein